MAHGYMREFDEGPDRSDDRDHDDWRERGDWRGQSDRGDRNWGDRERGDYGRDRGRDFMFGDDGRRDYGRGRDDDRRGFGSQMRSWLTSEDDRGGWESNRDDPQRNRGQSSYGNYGRDQQQRGFFGASDRDQGRNQYSSNRDDHYRSWRNRQLESLDRDYADYCREREQQFHSDFDSWRQNRQSLRGPAAAQGSGPDEQTFTPETTAVGNTMTTSETHVPQSTTDPEDTLTLGGGSRGRR